MQGAPTPIVKDLVLLGGGHSHIAVLRRFGMKPLPGVRITLITRDVHTPYSGMLPGYIAGHYEFDETHIDLGPLARFAGARLFHDSAVGLDLEERRVLCANRPPVGYDVLSIDIGSQPSLDETPGARESVIPVKPIGGLVARWHALRERVRSSTTPLRIGVVGAGAGGVEILLALQYALREVAHTPELHLVTGSAEILPTHNPGVRARFGRVLADRGVVVHQAARVARVRDRTLDLGDGTELVLDEVLWATQAGAAPWLAETGLALDAEGFIAVEDTLRSTSHPDVFAAGDVAAVLAHPREKSGVFAVRQGRPLARNLRRALLGKAPLRFAPQRNFLSLISTGDAFAVASRGRHSAEGALLWRWKDWIDRRFMRRYTELPDMSAREAPKLGGVVTDAETLRTLAAATMRCGGCGAKVGAPLLSRVLERVSRDCDLRALGEGDVLIGLDSPDDAAAIRIPEGTLSIQSVDFFRAIVDDPYLMGKIAANHSLGDLYAMGAHPQSALAIITLPFAAEKKVEEALEQVLRGALEILIPAGANLVGGHTGEGPELSVGFAVTGYAREDEILRKGGMRPGDQLLITKPIGTGALFAAEMRGRARGRWVSGALDTMVQSNAAAARILALHGATACTDVTGFGVAGHLLEMARASEASCEIDLESVPLLPGALEVTAQGIASSLQPENLRLRHSVFNAEAFATHPVYPLLFDPQTAGGLLASVPAERALACLDALRLDGNPEAAAIGRVLPRSHAEAPILLRAASPPVAP